jgi:hypothetical protein
MVVIGGKDGKKQLITGVPSYHGWYDRAQVGMHHRMGDKVVQDYGLSNQAAVALEAVLEKEWEVARTNAKKAGDCSAGLFCVDGLCPGVERRRDHKHRIKWSDAIFCRWGIGYSKCHFVAYWEV